MLYMKLSHFILRVVCSMSACLAETGDATADVSTRALDLQIYTRWSHREALRAL